MEKPASNTPAPHMLAQRLAGHLPPKKSANSSGSTEMATPVSPIGGMQGLIEEAKALINEGTKEAKVLTKEEQEREDAMKRAEAVK